VASGMRRTCAIRSRRITGSGKTTSSPRPSSRSRRPTLVIAHNKTLAAQLAAEFKEFFPNNAVEYFVSYYDFLPA